MTARFRALCAVSLLLGAAAPAFGVTEDIASVPVSLSIPQSCLVQSAATPAIAQPPVVRCEHDEVFSVSTADTDPTWSAAVANGAIEAANADTAERAKVWMVAF